MGALLARTDLAGRPRPAVRRAPRQVVRGRRRVLTAAAAAGVRAPGGGHQRDGLRRAAGQRGAAAGGRARCARCRTTASSATCWRSSRLAAAPAQATPACRSRWSARPRWSAPASTPCSPGTSRRRGCWRSSGCAPGLAVLPRRRPGLGAVVGRRRAGPRAGRHGRLRRLAGAGARSSGSGHAAVELRAALAFGTAERLHRVGVLPAPASDLPYVVHPWVVPSRRAARGGLGARRTTTRPAWACCSTQVRGPPRAWRRRRVDRRDAALGAAGAAVALVGTAALVRRRRRKRRRSMNDRRRTNGPVGARSSWSTCARTPCRSTRCSRRCATRAAGGTRVHRRGPRQDDGAAVDGLGLHGAPEASDDLRAVAAGGRRRRTPSSRSPPSTGSATSRSATSRSSSRCAPAPRRGVRACRELIDKLKATVPIWKHQLFSDGADEWVGLP